MDMEGEAATAAAVAEAGAATTATDAAILLH